MPSRAQPYPTSFDSLLTLDYTRDRLDLNTLRGLRPDDLPLLRGVVFGRHGRVFRNEDVQEWLESQDWYHPDSAFTNASLGDVERANLDVIRFHSLAPRVPARSRPATWACTSADP